MTANYDRFTAEGEDVALGIELRSSQQAVDAEASEQGACGRATGSGSSCQVGLWYLKTQRDVDFHNWTSHGGKHPGKAKAAK